MSPTRRHRQQKTRQRWAVAAVGFAAWLLPAAVTAAPPGLVLHFDFDQNPTAGRLPDKGGKQNHGKLAGGQWTAAGKSGGGLECGSARGGAVVEKHPLPATGRATLGAWLRSTKNQPHPRLIVGCNGFQLFLAGDGESRGKVVAEVAGNPACASDTAVTDGGWHHAAAVFDGTKLTVFLDGVPQKQVVNCTTPVTLAPGALLLGTNVPAKDEKPERTPALDGTLDEVTVFDRALSTEELKAVVAAIDPRAGSAKPKFTKGQVAGQIRNLELLYEEGLLTDAFYLRKRRELEESVAE